MIIVRSPLRLSLGGGGTDLPSYYRRHSGFVVAAAIDKYVYITLTRRFVSKILLKYMRMEEVDTVDEIQHPLFREALRMVCKSPSYLEITSTANVPAGTGLGSSGSFSVALLMALNVYVKNILQPMELAEAACKLEIDILKEPVGKQDQYIAAFGGITSFHFRPDDRVEVAPLKLSDATLYNLEDNLILFFTGFSRQASGILREQDESTRKDDREMVNNLHFIKELGQESKAALEQGNLNRFGRIMNEHWEYKKKRSNAMSNPKIDDWYQLALDNGAIGGKLVGAGGGGFLMFLCEDKVRLRHALRESGLEEVRFRFDFSGAEVLIRP